jgi:hypothetical protein
LNTRPSISYMSKIRNTVRVENKAEAAGDANA